MFVRVYQIQLETLRLCTASMQSLIKGKYVINSMSDYHSWVKERGYVHISIVTFIPGYQGLKSTATGLLWWYVAMSFPPLSER